MRETSAAAVIEDWLAVLGREICVKTNGTVDAQGSDVAEWP